MPNLPKGLDYHHTRDGYGVLTAVRKLFAGGTFVLGEGDALIPLQEAYLEWRKANEPQKQKQD